MWTKEYDENCILRGYPELVLLLELSTSFATRDGRIGEQGILFAEETRNIQVGIAR
jgi:hypothetical protein